MKSDPEEMVLSGRELFIYFPNGMARPKLKIADVDKALKTRGTGRNWNTVLQLSQLADEADSSSGRKGPARWPPRLLRSSPNRRARPPDNSGA